MRAAHDVAIRNRTVTQPHPDSYLRKTGVSAVWKLYNDARIRHLVVPSAGAAWVTSLAAERYPRSQITPFEPMRIATTSLVLLAIAATFAAVPVHAQRVGYSERRRDQYQKLRQETMLDVRHEITELSQQCHEQGLAQAARDLTEISLELTSPDQNRTPPTFVQLPVSNRLSPDEQAWRNRLRKIRVDRAKELYILARKALRADLPSLAYEIVNDVLKLNPDDTNSRLIMGQRLFHDPLRKDDPTYAGEWVSPFEARQRSGSEPQTLHPIYGWVSVGHVARYEEGLRPWRGKWISAQKEAEIRRDFENAWEIRSEHFEVKTNTSLEEGVAISRKLELFHDWLQSHFAGFFDTPDALEERFEQAAKRRRGRAAIKPMKVFFFATRQEYDRRMRGKIPPGQETNGMYWEPDSACYFFRNPEDPDHRTVFHEATHQILDMATRSDRIAAAKKKQQVLRRPRAEYWKLCGSSNFWIIEGLACYFESFEVNDGVTSVGRPDYIRFAGAKQRYLVDNFFVPTQLFCKLGQEKFMGHPNRAQFYTQASGLCHFLLHYDDGVYRDDLVKLLSAVYRPDLKNVLEQPSLEKITQVRFGTLDQQYRDHLEGL